ncbi:hypothetical protein CGMCC3_g11631 [Colletotrichum fructicola]|nr:uncharacterized protein CGMCC3_g11631 [Colletotrichum fructicola]KAE9572298.1 hypothetical protein CGMCC3_g11631 [Colletotrichum fructicola]
MASDTIWMSESQDIEHPHPVVNKFRAWRTLTRWLLEGIPIYDLCDEHTYTTPLMRGLSYSVRHYVPALRPLPREKRRGRRNASRAMTYWLEDVEASGIDLMEYGKLEHEMRYRIAISEDHGTSSCDDAWWLSEPQPVLRSFEPESENWSIWWEPSAYQFAGEFWYTIENPYLRMPGAWLADSYDEPDSHFSYDEEHGWDSLHVRELHFPVEKLAKALDPTDIHKALSTDHEVQKKDSALVSESTDPGRISSGPSRQEPYHGTESESQTIVDKRKASKTLRKEGEKATYASGNGLYRLSTWAQITINVVSQAHKHEITRKHFSSEIWRLVHDSDLIIEDNHQNLLGVLVSLWVYLAVVDSSMIASMVFANLLLHKLKERLGPKDFAGRVFSRLAKASTTRRNIWGLVEESRLVSSHTSFVDRRINDTRLGHEFLEDHHRRYDVAKKTIRNIRQSSLNSGLLPIHQILSLQLIDRALSSWSHCGGLQVQLARPEQSRMEVALNMITKSLPIHGYETQKFWKPALARGHGNNSSWRPFCFYDDAATSVLVPAWVCARTIKQTGEQIWLPMLVGNLNEAKKSSTHYIIPSGWVSRKFTFIAAAGHAPAARKLHLEGYTGSRSVVASSPSIGESFQTYHAEGELLAFSSDRDSSSSSIESGFDNLPRRPTIEDEKSRIVDNVVSQVLQNLDDYLKLVSLAGETESSSEIVLPNRSRVPDDSRTSRLTDAKRKRNASHNKRNGLQDEDEEDEEGDGTSLPKRQARERDSSSIRYACQCFKHNPRKYNRRPCSGPGWLTVRHVKDHLYRHHRAPKYICQRCQGVFTSEPEVGEHARAQPPCEAKDPVRRDEFSREQEERIRSRPSRKADERRTERQRWEDDFRILFDVPDDDIPTPYYDFDMAIFEREETFDEYVRHEIMPMLRSHLETEVTRLLSDIEPNILRRVEEIIRGLQAPLRRSYLFDQQQTQNALDTGNTNQYAGPTQAAPSNTSNEVPRGEQTVLSSTALAGARENDNGLWASTQGDGVLPDTTFTDEMMSVNMPPDFSNLDLQHQQLEDWDFLRGANSTGQEWDFDFTGLYENTSKPNGW